MLVHFATLLVSRHPLIGAGLGAFVGYLPLYEYPHNVALEVAAELGIPAALIVLGPMLAGFVLLLRRGILEASPAAASLVMILIVFGVTANFAGDVASNRALWVFAGVALKLGVDALGLCKSSPID
jgi:O-antigen ligase